MKKVILVSLVLSVFCLSFSIIVSLSSPLSVPDNAPPGETSGAASGETSPLPEPSPKAEYVYEDDDVTVRVSSDETVSVMTMSEYLRGVVAAEMPAIFDLEALRAQAVAARTITLYHMLHPDNEKHPDADVCTDFSCCQAYMSDAALREKWGTDYSVYLEKVDQAVRSTDGICMVYDNAPIQAVFHSSSAGWTAESGEVWSASLPYLVSVQSPETTQNVPNYVSTVTVSVPDFKDTVLRFYPDAVFTADSAAWVTGITYTGSGRIGTVRLGGVTVTGPVLRNMFGLRSTAADINVEEDSVVFTTTGYGHGVGMSQYGANAFAHEGKNYRDILSWYYTGVTFAHEKDFIGS